MSRKRVCLVGPRWSLADCARHVCGDRSHAHLSRAQVYDYEKHRSIVWIAVQYRGSQELIPTEHPDLSQMWDRGIVKISKLFTLRGASCGLGAYLESAVRARESWALTMVNEIRGRRESGDGRDREQLERSQLARALQFQ
jgi:hypothetical protein